MRNISILLFLLSFVRLYSFADNGRLVFTSSDTTQVMIAKPIDGLSNQYLFQDTISLCPGIVTNYTFDTDNINVINIKHGNNMFSYAVYVVPDSELYIHINRGTHTIKSREYAELDYLNRRKAPEVTAYCDELDSCFAQVGKGKDVSRLFRDGFPRIQIPEIKFSTYPFSSRLQEIIKKKTEYDESNEVIDRLNKLIKDGTLSEKDSLLVMSCIDSICQKYLPVDKFFNYYSNGDLYLSKYSKYRWNSLSDAERKERLDGYDEDTFGPYVRYLVNTSSNILRQLGQVFIFQFLYQCEEFDREKMLHYLHDKFPQTETYAICKRMYEESLRKEASICIKEEVKSLKEILLLEELKGRFVVMDLWATWCTPCRLEMRYAPMLHDYVNSLKNVAWLYLSFDEDVQAWEKVSKSIPGIHLRVSEELMSEIKEKVYDGQTTPIPRYVLLSPTGEVLNKGLAFPSMDIEKMKRQIAEGVKKEKTK